MHTTHAHTNRTNDTFQIIWYLYVFVSFLFFWVCYSCCHYSFLSSQWTIIADSFCCCVCFFSIRFPFILTAHFSSRILKIEALRQKWEWVRKRQAGTFAFSLKTNHVEACKIHYIHMEVVEEICFAAFFCFVYSLLRAPRWYRLFLSRRTNVFHFSPLFLLIHLNVADSTCEFW